MAQKSKTTQGKRVPAYTTDSIAVRVIVGLLLIALGVLIFLATVLNMTGDIFLTLRHISRGMMGSMSVLLPVIPIWGGILVMISARKDPPVRPYALSCVLMMFVCTIATLITYVGSQSLMDYTLADNISRGVGESMTPFMTRAYEYGVSARGVGGGLIGMLLAWPVWKGLGAIGGAVIMVLLSIAVFLFIVRPDVKGMAASFRSKHAQHRARVEEEQLRIRQQELAWQQEQMRIQQEQARIQQEQARQQEIAWQQEQMRRQQEQSRRQAAPYQNPIPQPAWGDQAAYAQSAPVVQQVEPLGQRRKSANRTKPGFQPAMQDQPAWQTDAAWEESFQQPAAAPKKKRTGIFQGSDDPGDPVAMPHRKPAAQQAAAEDFADTAPRRRSIFERPAEAAAPRKSAFPDNPFLADEEDTFPPIPQASPAVDPAAGQKAAPTARSRAAAAPQAVPAPPVQKMPGKLNNPAEQDAPADQDAPANQEPSARSEGTGFLARLKAARAAAGAPVDAEPAAPARKSRKDTPSGWSQQAETPAKASWRNDDEWQSEAPAARPTARSAAKSSTPESPAAARIQRAAAPEKQQPKASWADIPPWEDSPDGPGFDLPDEPAIPAAPVVTQKAPEGAWQPDLKLQPRRQAATALPNSAMFDEPQDIPYVFPPMQLLKQPETSAEFSDEEDAMRSRRLENTLQSFRVPAKVRHITHGPAISRFELELAPGIKVSKVTDLNRNIAMNMEVKSVRIEAPIPGTSYVGVEVPNKQRATVTLREVLESSVMAGNTKPLVVALGKDIAGVPIICDLSKMPHLLVAGATGSGKSVCINTIINSLLYRCSPKDVRLILVDPKVVELQGYNGIPHLLIPVVSDPHKAAGALAWAVGEMMDRYKRFQERGVRNIDGYNEQLDEGEENMPRIVIIIDELADLMMTCKKDVEDRICRLAQLARAAGIHLIVATQRPSTDVITGLIKANFPSRIAFKVSSNVDSRTILDRIGAEQLLGYGDMLYMPTGEFTPIRVQGCFLADQEVNSITDFIRDNCPAAYDPLVLEELDRLQAESDAAPMPDLPSAGSSSDSDSLSDKELLRRAAEMTISDGQISTSFIQRQLSLGYSRAGRIVDMMEKLGIVSAKDGAKPRKCLITLDQYEQMIEDGII